ncbi:hypothetical protein N7460_001516 [Penicillium canescens]|uniref:Uncharacterized protein n=1 Tax=Penicillium canescens TaxID=5083 RepID=A0AAD6NCT8_PENCN|nr:hypothetical protein N7460_001516 [Penicillium canescens]
MARWTYYLLTLLLSSLASLLWLSSSLKTSTPVLTLTYGACECQRSDRSVTPTSSKDAASASVSSQSPTITLGLPAPESASPSSHSPYIPVKPYDQLLHSPFPSKLWQKAGPNGIDEARQKDIESWQIRSPALHHEVLTGASADQYRPHVTCHQPIGTWIPEKYRNKTNLVVGLEFDGLQFHSWTVMEKPKSRHIAAVIRYIAKALKDSAGEYHKTIAGLTMQTISDFVDVTGPQAMTLAILESLSVEMRQPVGRPNISNLHEPVLPHDVLVLPNAAFAAQQGGWSKDRGPYMVEHHYAGSWKNDKGGETTAKPTEVRASTFPEDIL